MERRRILITNDDGIDAEGFRSLMRRLERDGHEILCVVPDRDCSAVSHGMTIGRPMPLAGRGARVYALAGKPADCVIAVVRGAFFRFMPDVVLSGINRGANLGTDIVYSGTAAAARQAVLLGIPGIALSMESYDGSWRFDPLADFAARNLGRLMRLCAEDVFVSVNAASRPFYNGAVMASLCRRNYNDSAAFEDGAVTISGGVLETDGAGDSDFLTTKNGRISVSCIHAGPILAETVEETDFIL